MKCNESWDKIEKNFFWAKWRRWCEKECSVGAERVWRWSFFFIFSEGGAYGGCNGVRLVEMLLWLEGWCDCEGFWGCEYVGFEAL